MNFSFLFDKTIKRTFCFFSICLLIALIGCGQEGVERHSLSGKVTFNGQPVPAGRVMFEPDSSKGNSGPQGYANIENGIYSTDESGKGVIRGALIVSIKGYNAKPGSAEGKRIRPLFPRYITHIDLAQDVTTMDFNIPAGNQR